MGKNLSATEIRIKSWDVFDKGSMATECLWTDEAKPSISGGTNRYLYFYFLERGGIVIRNEFL